MIIVYCDQGTPEWYEERAGAITASMFSTVRDVLKRGPDKGDYKEAAKNYAFRLAIERIADQPLQDGQFETYAMRRGHELEPEARAAHELKIGCNVERTGLVLTDDSHFGVSADGLIDEDGGSEYKCFTAPEKLRDIILKQDIDDLMDQCQGAMWITGRKWWHLGFYCPQLSPAGKDLILHGIERDDDYIEAMEKDLLAFDALVERYRAEIENAPTMIGADIEQLRQKGMGPREEG